MCFLSGLMSKACFLLRKLARSHRCESEQLTLLLLASKRRLLWLYRHALFKQSFIYRPCIHRRSLPPARQRRRKGQTRKCYALYSTAFHICFLSGHVASRLLLDADLCQPQGCQTRRRHSTIQPWCFCLSSIAFSPASNQKFAKSCRGRQTNLFADRGGFDFATCCSFSQEVLIRVTLCL